jgi:hypothetical protein
VHYYIYWKRIQTFIIGVRLPTSGGGLIVLFPTSIQWLPGLERARPEADHPPSSSAQFTDEEICKSTTRYAFMVTPGTLASYHRTSGAVVWALCPCFAEALPGGGCTVQHSGHEANIQSVWTNGPLPHHITLISHLALIQHLWIHSGSHIFSLSALAAG